MLETEIESSFVYLFQSGLYTVNVYVHIWIINCIRIVSLHLYICLWI